MSQNKGVLHGLRVIEAASMIMVPAAGAILAEYGAEVIKIEPPEGDLNRRGHLIPGMPDSEVEYAFLPANRNKRSMVVDLKSEEGRQVLRRLVKESDVFLTNYRRKALEDLKLTWDDLKGVNPRLIYAHGTGFGDNGAEADKPGFDAVCYWARSGLEAHMFPLEGWPGPLAYGAGDHPSAMSLYGAVMTALFSRERTGVGARISISLMANGAWSNSVFIQAKLCDAKFHPRQPRENAYNVTGVYYRIGGGRLLKMSVVNVEQGWPRICRALGRPDLIDDPRYATAQARTGRVGELIRIFDEIFIRHDMTYWKDVLERHDIPFSVISTYDDVVRDEQLAANDVFIEVDDPQFGRLRTITSPIHIYDHPKVPPRTAPRLGENTREILAQFSFDAREVEELVQSGAVKAG